MRSVRQYYPLKRNVFSKCLKHSSEMSKSKLVSFHFVGYGLSVLRLHIASCDALQQLCLLYVMSIAMTGWISLVSTMETIDGLQRLPEICPPDKLNT